MRIERRAGFTLIEVLIVVVIMAVLAATIIPQFSSSTKDAQNSSVKFNAHSLRSQIELYKAHHLGNYPTLTGTDLPQLTKATNVEGATADKPDTAHPYGPYLDAIPKNPFNDDSTIKPLEAGTVPDKGDGTSGWLYDATTGAIYPNHTGWTKP